MPTCSSTNLAKHKQKASEKLKHIEDIVRRKAGKGEAVVKSGLVG